MMKDITNVLEQDAAGYEADNKLSAMILDELMVLTIKDLYNYSYDLKEEMAKDKPSKRKIFSLKKTLDEIMEYFNSPLYCRHCQTPKGVWLKWASEAIQEPRININKLIDDQVGIKIKEYDFALSQVTSHCKY